MAEDPQPAGVFYTGTYEVDGDVEALAAENVLTAEGLSAVADFVGAGIGAQAPTITLVKTVGTES